MPNPVVFVHGYSDKGASWAAWREILHRRLDLNEWDRLPRQQRGVDDQWLGGGVQLGCFLDGECESLRYRQTIVIFGRRMVRVVEQAHRRSLEALAVVGK